MPQPPKVSAETILSRALQLLETQGEAALTLRTLAATLHVTPNALYWHYADRAALLAALAAHGLNALQRDLAQAQPAQARTLADLLPVAEAYLHFARTRPHLYALMTAPGRDPGLSAGLWHDVTALLTPHVGPERAPEVGVALWAYLHGVVGLEAMNPFHDGKPQEGMRRGLQALLRGLREEV